MPKSALAAAPPAPPIVAGFFMPCPCGGSSGFLSGLFFGGIHCRSPTLSACICFLVPSRYRRRTIPLLQGRDRACTGRFPGVASCTTPGTFARPAPSRRLPGRHGSPVAAIPGPENRRFFAGILEDFSGEFFLGFFAGHSR